MRAHPVGTSEQEHATHDSDEPDKFDPYEVVLNRMSRLEVGEVISEADRTCHDVHTTDDCHGQGTFVHVTKLFQDISDEPHVPERVHQSALYHLRDGAK